jgi:predicted metal-binding membrane protein
MVSVPDVGRRAYLALVVALVAAAGCAWATAPLVLSHSPAFGLVWLLVTVAVLLPSAAPMVATFTALRHAVAGIAGACWGTLAFVAGYAAAWAAVGCVGYVLATGARVVGWGHAADAALLAVAAGYQLTSFKDRCLANCRVPLSFLMTSWRDGVAGAFDMGAGYGARCVGVGALLVGWLIAHGSNQLVSMAVVAALIAIEKLAPSRVLARRSVAAVLLFLAGVSAFAPAAAPWL